jgi:hypothetical protein
VNRGGAKNNEMVMDQEILEEPRKRVDHPVILVRHTDIPGTSVSSQKNHIDVRYVLRISHMHNILHFWHDSPVQSDSDLRICSMFALFPPLRRLEIPLDPFRDLQRILLEAVHHDRILPFQLHTFDATHQNIPKDEVCTCRAIRKEGQSDCTCPIPWQ